MMSQQRLHELRVGFSFALASLYYESFGHDWNLPAEKRPEGIRCTNAKLPSDMPVGVRDRFAYYTQTLRLSRPDIERLRASIFATEADECRACEQKVCADATHPGYAS